MITKDLQYYKFCLYGFLKNLRLFEPILLLFLLENKLTYLQIGSLFTILEIVRNIFEIPSGVISDILGRRKTMLASFSAYIFSFMIFYFAGSYLDFSIAMIFFAFGDAFRSGTHKAMIFQYLKINNWMNQKTTYYGHTRSWSQFGSAISALLSGIIIFYTGSYKIVFLFSTIPYILDFVNIATYPSELEGSWQKNLSIKEKTQQIILAAKESFMSSPLLKAIINISAHSGYYKISKDFIQPILYTYAISITFLNDISEKQKTAIVIGVVYFFIYIITSRASSKAGYFASKFNYLSTLLNHTLIISLTLGIVSGLLFYYNYYLLSILVMLIVFIIENLRKPAGVAFVSDHSNDNILATTLSIQSQARSLIAAIIAPAIGFFADIYGIGIAISCISLLMLLLSPFIVIKRKP